MALILKNGRTYHDPRDGEIDTAYAHIDRFLNAPKDKKIEAVVRIFVSEESRLAGRAQTEERVVTIEQPDYDAFFNEDSLKLAGKTTITQLYAFIEDHPDWQDWESDE